MFLKGVALLHVLDLFKDLRTLGRKESPTVFNGLPQWFSGKESTCNARDVGDAGSVLGWGRSPEKEMTIHSSILPWRIPWAEESGGLQSIGSQRIGHNWRDWSWIVFNNFWAPFHDIILEVSVLATNRNILSLYLHNIHFRFHPSVMFCFQSYLDI